MNKNTFAATSIVGLAALIIPLFAAASDGGDQPGCLRQSPRECIAASLDAMGGEKRLRELKSIHLKSIGHQMLVEQSYRQDPFITAYAREETILDLTGERLWSDAKSTWPESDNAQAESEAILIVDRTGGVFHAGNSDSPCGLSTVRAARQLLLLGPARLLLTAYGASDLHFEAPQPLRSTPHAVVAFTWNGVPVRVLLNSFNHLPDAVQTTQVFQDMWYFWGDVAQQVYFDNWKLVQGISFPTNQIEERNGIIWASNQVLDIKFDEPLDEHLFAMDSAIAKRSEASGGWSGAFSGKKSTALAPGIDLFLGAWNSTIVKQSDGIVILEAPISEVYTKGIMDEAHRRYPDTRIKAVISTSDSWPHVGGLRYVESQSLPIYILDLNRPLLDRMNRAAHHLERDALARVNRSAPQWRIVASKTVVGAGENRIELYPLRGASTERQIMAYFPQLKVLYASDTLVLNDDGTLYEPELMQEVARAVAREKLQVETVFAMHQSPVAWEKVTSLIESANRK